MDSVVLRSKIADYECQVKKAKKSLILSILFFCIWVVSLLVIEPYDIVPLFLFVYNFLWFADTRSAMKRTAEDIILESFIVEAKLSKN